MADVMGWFQSIQPLQWVEIVGKIIVFFYAVIVTIIAHKKKVKDKKESKMKSFILEDVKKVEEIYKQGEVKLAHVLLDTEQYCNEIKMKFNKSKVIDIVEEILETPCKIKEVNPYGKKNDKTQR